ncbi:MAG: deaminase [Candidatus Pacearchaeota archaeon]
MKNDINELGEFVQWKKPKWDEYFMAQAFVISTRSIDPSTKHGCIVTDEENRPLTFGYNGPPRGCDDSQIPLSRPDKYAYFAHAEENAINNAANKGVSLNNSVFYITGHPCTRCLRSIINVRASKIVYGSVDSHCISDEDKKAMGIMLKNRNLIIVPFEGDILSVLEKTISYYRIKVLGSRQNERVSGNC